MDLKEFVQTTIVQIVEGVVAAQTAVARRGAAVNPAFDLSAKAGHSPTGFSAAGARVSNITFDVAVTAVEGTGAEGGARLHVAGVASPSIGADRERQRGARHAAAVLAAPLPARGSGDARAGRTARLALPSAHRQRRQYLAARQLSSGHRHREAPSASVIQ